MQIKRVLILTNPKSGKGRAPEFAISLIEQAKARDISAVMLEPIDASSAIADLKQTLNRSSFDAVIAIGGDGLVHLILQALAKSGTPLYVVPAGTGNDFARANASITVKPREILDTMLGQNPRKIDIGEIVAKGSQRYFGQILSTGFDAQVNERANKNRIVKGAMKYNFATLVVLPKFSAINYELEIDGTLRKLPAMLVAVANGPTYGGGMQLCPMADRHDGYLDVMILHPVSKLELIKVFPKVYSGKHISHPAVEFIRAREISIAANTIAYADGERISKLPIKVSISPESLVTWVKSR